MGRIFRNFLPSSQVYTCSGCDSHLTDEQAVISKSFRGRIGRAFLFDKAVNVTQGRIERRELLSGVHKVADVRCSICDNLLGWRFVEAKDEAQKYKEGRFLFEKIRLSQQGNWE